MPFPENAAARWARPQGNHDSPGGGLQVHHKGGIPESAVENRAGSQQALTCTPRPRYMGARQATQGPPASQEAKKQQCPDSGSVQLRESPRQTSCPAHVHAGIKRRFFFCLHSKTVEIRYWVQAFSFPRCKDLWHWVVVMTV